MSELTDQMFTNLQKWFASPNATHISGVTTSCKKCDPEQFFMTDGEWDIRRADSVQLHCNGLEWIEVTFHGEFVCPTHGTVVNKLTHEVFHKNRLVREPKPPA